MDKSKLMMTIIIALLIILLGTVVAVTLYLINFVGDGDTVIPEAGPAHVLSVTDLEPISLGDLITTHLAYGADGRVRMIRTGITVGIDTTGNAAEYTTFISDFTHRINFARGLAVTTLNGLTYDQIRTPEGQLMTAEMILNGLQELFETNLIVNVTFYDWLAT